MEEFLSRWGYVAIVVGTFFEGESVLLLAGALASRGTFSLPLVILTAFVGSVSGDQVWFHLGHRFGRPFVEKRPRWQVRASRVQTFAARYGDWFVVGFRFIYGLRTVSPAVLGTSGYPARKFNVLNAVGAALWSVTFGTLGYALAASLERVLHRAGRIEELALVAVVLAAIVVGITWRKRRAVIDTKRH